MIKLILPTLLSILLPILPTVLCHLVFNRPETWGINDVSLEQPLDVNTENPLCAGRVPENNGIIHFVAGETYYFDLICGEKDLNAIGCLTGDWHSGSMNNDYAGCALSVNYNDYRIQNDYKYMSYSQDCAKRGDVTGFVISKNIQNCDRCVCSWSWAPSRKYSSPGQFYHNCFYCSISGGIDNNNVIMRSLDFINIRGSIFSDITYNDIRPDDIYDNGGSTRNQSNENNATVKNVCRKRIIRKNVVF